MLNLCIKLYGPVQEERRKEEERLLIEKAQEEERQVPPLGDMLMIEMLLSSSHLDLHVKTWLSKRAFLCL